VLRLLAGEHGRPSSRFWGCFEPERADQLRWEWETERRDDPGRGPDEVRKEHAAQARPDLTRVHPSWFLRGLQGESPAVQRLVAANIGSALRGTMLRGLGLSRDDLKTDRRPDPDAVLWALSLWTERLVGDQSEKPDDLLVIEVLSQHCLRECYRMVRAAGLAKWALAGVSPPPLRGRELGRLTFFQEQFRNAKPVLRSWASRDVSALKKGGAHPLARLGMVTVARLLDGADAHRVRWALQHIPYPVAKFTRSLMTSRPRQDATVRCEESILRTACSRVHDEAQARRSIGGGT
jgi:hypothetical protein